MDSYGTFSKIVIVFVTLFHPSSKFPFTSYFNNITYFHFQLGNERIMFVFTVLALVWPEVHLLILFSRVNFPEVDSLNRTVGRRPQVNLRSRARHWSGCTQFEHRALDLRLTWGFLPQPPFKKPVSVLFYSSGLFCTPFHCTVPYSTAVCRICSIFFGSWSDFAGHSGSGQNQTFRLSPAQFFSNLFPCKIEQ